MDSKFWGLFKNVSHYGHLANTSRIMTQLGVEDQICHVTINGKTTSQKKSGKNQCFHVASTNFPEYFSASSAIFTISRKFGFLCFL